MFFYPVLSTVLVLMFWVSCNGMQIDISSLFQSDKYYLLMGKFSTFILIMILIFLDLFLHLTFLYFPWFFWAFFNRFFKNRDYGCFLKFNFFSLFGIHTLYMFVLFKESFLVPLTYQNVKANSIQILPNKTMILE